MDVAVATYTSLEDYFELESTSEEKHEWSHGAVFAMSRASPTHERLQARMTRALGDALGDECELYGSSLMLFVEEAQLSTYADLTAICGQTEMKKVTKNGVSLGEAATNPTIIVEVLSDSTERYDREGKFKAYQLLPSLEEYVLVTQHESRIEVFRRDSRGNWAVEVGESGGTVTVHGAKIAVNDVSARVASA